MAVRYRAGGYGYGHAKAALHARMEDYLADARVRRAELDRRPGVVEEVLQAGASRARALARATTDRAREACGLGGPVVGWDEPPIPAPRSNLKRFQPVPVAAVIVENAGARHVSPEFVMG